jgi:hypothetical protein
MSTDRRLPYVVLVVAAFVLVVLHATAYTVIGPKDELQHIDYADKVAHLEYPRFPEPIGQRPLREQACRRIDSPFNAAVPPCDQPAYDPNQFQEGGLSTQTFHPPLYYVAVGIPARVVAKVFGLDGLVGVERLLGAVWLGAALCLIYAAARRLGADPWITVALLLMVASTGQILYVHSTVSNDATAVFTGALCLWAVTRDKATWRTGALLVLAGLVAGGTKITNGFGVGAACLFALFAPWAPPRATSGPAFGLVRCWPGATSSRRSPGSSRSRRRSSSRRATCRSSTGSSRRRSISGPCCGRHPRTPTPSAHRWRPTTCTLLRRTCRSCSAVPCRS